MPSAGLHYFKGTNSKRKMTWLLRFWVFPWNSTALLSATTHFRSRLGTVLFSCLCKSSLPAFTQTGHNYQALPRSSCWCLNIRVDGSDYHLFILFLLQCTHFQTPPCVGDPQARCRVSSKFLLERVTGFKKCYYSCGHSLPPWKEIDINEQKEYMHEKGSGSTSSPPHQGCDGKQGSSV